MTPAFDFSAFLNSPGTTDLTGLNTSLSNDLVDTLDGVGANFNNDVEILPDWAQNIPMEPTKEGVGIASSYRAGIAAHHMAQLNHWLPQMGGAAGGASAGGGGVGQRSKGGSHSSPSVPLSQAARMTAVKRPSELTIQERRRLTRRGMAAGSGLRNVVKKPVAAPPVVLDPDQGVRNPISRHAYSSTGFDLIGALIKVATRANPKVEIGPVDLSCSFTVSDARHPDQPIVHCSDTFCQLTGYDRSEIMGRNCRFLQSPDGHVEAGTERSHTDNGAVRHMKKHVSRMQECQTSLINYRRDGTPFINLVTIIPITWGDSVEPVFLVGFQVDLVEQPGAIMERKSNGIYVVNYTQSRQQIEQEFVNADASKKAILAQELAEIISSGSEETSKWARILLDHSHDMIYVLSLKGTFLYVSPSVEKILGYKSEELVGKSISEFCHPSDVVPVFRELKDSTSNASIAAAARQWARFDGTVNPPTKGGAGQTGPQVNLIMRMKHKHNGHEWIESVGKLHLEQGKGRKVVISTGRPRPIYNLPWEQARRSLNSRAPGFWFKASTSGLILSTSGNVTDVVDGEHEGAPLAGKHIKNVVDANAAESLMSALNALQVSAVPHLIGSSTTSAPQMVISTVIPSSSGGTGMPSVFVFTQKASAEDFESLQQNALYCQDASLAAAEASEAASLKAGEPGTGSVFGELSTLRSSSWVFEMHQLKNANKRLREEVRAHQRRISSGGRLTLAVLPQSASKTKPAVPTKPVTSIKLSNTTPGYSSGTSGSSTEATSNTPSGMVTDSSAGATTVSSGSDESPVVGMKRSRS